MAGTLPPAIQPALRRADALMAVLDRGHTPEEAYRVFRAVRQEVRTALSLLSQEANPAALEPISPRALRATATHSGSARHRILRCLSDCGPLTDSEIQDTLTMVGSSERTRRNELVAANWVRPVRTPEGISLVRTRDLTGVDQQVWEITDAGRAALDKLNAGQQVMAFEGDPMTCTMCGWPISGSEFLATEQGPQHTDSNTCVFYNRKSKG